jgi:hypothetical protein
MTPIPPLPLMLQITSARDRLRIRSVCSVLFERGDRIDGDGRTTE